MPHRMFVGDWLVESQLNQIRDGERTVHLESRSVEVLVCLASRPGEVIGKSAIIDQVWGETHVTEEVLTHAIWELRKAFADDARQPRFIQTVHKKGYRLIAPVHSPPARDGAEAGADSAPARRRWRPSAAIAALAAIGLLAFTLVRRQPVTKTAAAAGRPESLLIVLPFDEQGGGERPPLATAITEALIRRIGDLEGVEVVARTVAEKHRDDAVEKIRETLSVEFMVRGSVLWFDQLGRRAQVRIAPELVRLQDGAQIWSRAYDRVLEDALLLVPEITGSIADELSVKLGISSDQVAANNAYLAALRHRTDPAYEHASRLKAVDFLVTAVRRSPAFVAAWAELAKTHAEIAFNADPSRHRRQLAQSALERAVHLAPEHPEVRIASAFVQYHALEDYEAAKASFAAVARDLPYNVEILRGLGYVHRRLGDLEASIHYLQAAKRLEPDAELSGFLAETFRAQRRWSEADRCYEQVREQAPDALVMWGESAMNLFDLTGSAQRARDLLAAYPVSKEPALLYYWLPLDLYAGDFHTAIDRYAHWERSDEPIDRIRNPWLVALAAERSGNHGLAEHLVEECRFFLEQCVAENPEYRYAHGYLALVYAFEGRPQDARASMAEALRLAEKDAFSGPRMRELAAMMHVLLGEHDRATEILEELFEIQYQHPISRARLRHDPIWQPLRQRDDFSTLAEAKGGNQQAVSP